MTFAAKDFSKFLKDHLVTEVVFKDKEILVLDGDSRVFDDGILHRLPRFNYKKQFATKPIAMVVGYNLAADFPETIWEGGAYNSPQRLEFVTEWQKQQREELGQHGEFYGANVHVFELMSDIAHSIVEFSTNNPPEELGQKLEVIKKAIQDREYIGILKNLITQWYKLYDQCVTLKGDGKYWTGALTFEEIQAQTKETLKAAKERWAKKELNFDEPVEETPTPKKTVNYAEFLLTKEGLELFNKRVHCAWTIWKIEMEKQGTRAVSTLDWLKYLDNSEQNTMMSKTPLGA